MYFIEPVVIPEFSPLLRVWVFTVHVMSGFVAMILCWFQSEASSPIPPHEEEKSDFISSAPPLSLRQSLSNAAKVNNMYNKLMWYVSLRVILSVSTFTKLSGISLLTYACFCAVF